MEIVVKRWEKGNPEGGRGNRGSNVRFVYGMPKQVHEQVVESVEVPLDIIAGTVARLAGVTVGDR